MWTSLRTDANVIFLWFEQKKTSSENWASPKCHHGLSSDSHIPYIFPTKVAIWWYTPFADSPIFRRSQPCPSLTQGRQVRQAPSQLRGHMPTAWDHSYWVCKDAGEMPRICINWWHLNSKNDEQVANWMGMNGEHNGKPLDFGYKTCLEAHMFLGWWLTSSFHRKWLDAWPTGKCMTTHPILPTGWNQFCITLNVSQVSHEMWWSLSLSLSLSLFNISIYIYIHVYLSFSLRDTLTG